MNRTQVVRKLRAYCKENGLEFSFDDTEGNGSHGTIYVGKVKTIAKHGEWPKVYLQAVLKQLGLPKDAI